MLPATRWTTVGTVRVSPHPSHHLLFHPQPRHHRATRHADALCEEAHIPGLTANLADFLTSAVQMIAPLQWTLIIDQSRPCIGTRHGTNPHDGQNRRKHLVLKSD